MTNESSVVVSEQPELSRVIGPRLLLLFIVGDILGTGVYALTGAVAGEVGGAGWAPILVAFFVATITAYSYLELVTKYPRAAGAALYVHKAFGVHFVTFLAAFAVLCSGITSASTASRFFAANLVEGFGLDWGSGGVTALAVAFIALLAVINLRGVGESVRLNVVLTAVELSGLLIVICIGLWVVGQGDADFSRVIVFESSGDKGAFMALTGATALAFFSMIGFEDSVNMVEEVKDPTRVFPKVMLVGLSITAAVYVLVSILSVALVPVGQLASSETPLLEVVRAGAPGLPLDAVYPFISMFAVANTALINMLMASRLLYGLANERVLPPGLAKVLPNRRSPWVSILFTTLIAVALIIVVSEVMESSTTSALGGTTALLLLAVFTVVNAAVLVLRKDRVDSEHFSAPKYLPYLGVVTCAFLLGPWAQDAIKYQIAGVLLGLGVVLWAGTWLWKRVASGSAPDVRA